ncbi:MAG: radical SAM protein [Planctomycetes bacterium]|nr:radical SAM protein [Planctomycetota bacterium]
MADMPKNVMQLRTMLTSCCLCPRKCGVDRTKGELGACGIGDVAKVSSAQPHFGEESILVGSGGSGAIFFSGCNLECVFCQNYDISQSDQGQNTNSDDIAELAGRLNQLGCENINFVTPTHMTHTIAEAIVLMRHQGINLPTVYNCGGYESVEVLQLLEGLIDIYMPDFKYANADMGLNYSGVKDYPDIATKALTEMHRQVGSIQLDQNLVAQKGVLIRHLVMPSFEPNSKNVLDIVANTAPGSTINVMGQYRPSYRANEFPKLTTCPATGTIQNLRQYAAQQGLNTDC